MTEPDDIVGALLGQRPHLDSSDVAAAAGVSVEEARRLWRALGFPDGDGAPAFTRADAKALHRAHQAADESGVGMDTIVRMTRGVGQTLSRLAEWEVSALSSHVQSVSDVEVRRERARTLLETLGPHFEALLLYSWRRHLAAAVARAEMLAPEHEAESAEATVGFADMVGFSAVTNDLDEAGIGDLVELFETQCADVMARHRGRVIKTLGDSVLFVAPDPPTGIDIAWEVIGVSNRREELPGVRVGVVTGQTVQRMGDVYGPAVNLAARLTTLARRNRVLTDHHTAELLPAESFQNRVLPARPVRGFGEMEPVAVRRRPEGGGPKP